MTTVDPPLPPPEWVTLEDLRSTLGQVINATLGQTAVDAANYAVAHRLAAGEAERLATSPPLKIAALTCAVDLYRRPATPAGVFQAGELYARLPADLFTSIDAAIVASGAQLAGGFA